MTRELYREIIETLTVTQQQRSVIDTAITTIVENLANIRELTEDPAEHQLVDGEIQHWDAVRAAVWGHALEPDGDASDHAASRDHPIDVDAPVPVPVPADEAGRRDR